MFKLCLQPCQIVFAVVAISTHVSEKLTTEQTFVPRGYYGDSFFRPGQRDWDIMAQISGEWKIKRPLWLFMDVPE